MNLALMDKIVNAVLYEGYMLYPYRPSSVKNQHRWTFGGICPEAYSRAQGGSEAWTMQTECLVSGADPVVELKLRFLHLLAREVGELIGRAADGDPAFRPVAALQVGKRIVRPWQEAVEREVSLVELRPADLLTDPVSLPFAFPASRMAETVYGQDGAAAGVIVREQQAVSGAVEIAATKLGGDVCKLTIRILNLTPFVTTAPNGRDDALLRSLVSTHTLLGVRDGAFVSLFDPPEPYRAAAATCQNAGCWPVLVGEEGRRDMMLASPIILYDYPQIAPESPGDLFDGTEIDEILTLRILTMTEDEKREMSAVDDRSRELLARTESLAREQLMGLHGTMRGLRPSGGAS